jgi:excisionase family DNA binding protein
MAATQEKPVTRRFLTVREAAAICNVSAPHMYRLVGEGSVPAIRVGNGSGPLRIEAGELEAWLDSRRLQR